MHTWNCVICGAVSERVRNKGTKCDQHRSWRQFDCTTCGNRFYANRATRPGRATYCSSDCQPEPFAPSTTLEWKQCTCGRWICRPHRKHCSRQCNREAGAIDRGLRNRTCMQCETSLGYHAARRRLCDGCRAINERNTMRADRAKRRHLNRHRKRARHYGVEYEPVRQLTVYARDGWRCGICRKKVDKRLKWPDQMCASLDHVVPMARGGGHTYANTQCSHWLCNTLKSDRGGGEQLALVG